MKIDEFILKYKTSKMGVEKCCKIKKYLKTEGKVKLIKEYQENVKEFVNPYADLKVFMSFIFFNLMIIKEYTNIELELTLDEYDQLQENGIVDEILKYIEKDYAFLLKMLEEINSYGY